MKERVSKRYRHPELDTKLNKQRLNQEARCMAKCLKTSISCPGIYLVDSKTFRIYMEHVAGVTVKQLVWSVVKSVKSQLNEVDFASPVLVELATSIGLLISKLHCIRMIHGDLTTSNLMVRRRVGSVGFVGSGAAAQSANPVLGSYEEVGQEVVDAVMNAYGDPSISKDSCGYGYGYGLEVVLIDFGLGKMQASVEDMAVDLYVLERAFTSTHPGCEVFLSNILYGYEQSVPLSVPAATDVEGRVEERKKDRANPNKTGSVAAHAKLIKEVVDKLEVVRMRGRKRDMVG